MSNEYDFQSYLYPAGSAASGGGAGSGTGAATPAPAKSIQVGNVTTQVGGYASVVARDTPTATILDFIIPRGLSAYELDGGDLRYGSVSAWLKTLKGDKGDPGDATITKGGILGALGSTPQQRMQALLPHFEAAYWEKPADMQNNEWYRVNFQQAFDDVVLDKPVVFVQPLLADYRNFLVRNITYTGFEIRCNYTPDFQGLFYVKFGTQ